MDKKDEKQAEQERIISDIEANMNGSWPAHAQRVQRHPECRDTLEHPHSRRQGFATACFRPEGSIAAAMHTARDNVVQAISEGVGV